MAMARTLPGVALLVLASVAAAEERFYPVIGPDGSVQMLRSPAASGPAASGASPKATPPEPESEDAGEEGAEPVPAQGLAAPYAPYDSDEYVDSEKFEAAGKPREGGKRFYLINDGMGRHVDEPEGSPSPVEAVAEPASRIAPARYTALTANRLEGGAEALGIPAFPRCLDARARGDALLLDEETARGLVVDEPAWRFLPPTRMLAAYAVAGKGPRTLQVRSYARKDKAPSFFHPRLVLLAADGCVTRVLQGYFDRLYKATDKRHAMLQGDVLVHADEAFMVVVAPADGSAGDAQSPFREARQGQLKFTLKK